MKNFYAVSVLIAAVVCSATCDETENLNRKHSPLVDEACKSNPNLECVREYFSKNGKCEVMAKSTKKRFHSKVKLPIFVPVANLTVITTETYLDGLDGDFEKFYFDKKTGNLVISINFKGVRCEAPDVILSVQQLGQEPKVVVEDVTATYPVVLTAYIPAQKKITAESLKQALISAYFPSTNSEVIIGPKFSESEDTVIAESYKSLAENLYTSVVEIFRTKASFVFLAYLQSRICNFDTSPAIQHKYDTTVLDNIIANNDNCEEATFSEPCSGSDDVMTCVRDYFDREGRCSVVREVEDPVLQRPRYNIYIPSSNFTAIVRNCEMTGLNGTIKKFFINHQTNNLVMTVEFKDIRIDIDEEVPLVIFQRGSTEIRALPYYKDDLYDVILTAVIPLGGGLTRKAMEKAVFSGYFPDFVSHELISPEEENIPQDALLAEIIRSMVAQPVTTAKELYVTDAGSVFRGYFQKYICDFNIPVDPKIYQRYPA